MPAKKYVTLSIYPAERTAFDKMLKKLNDKIKTTRNIPDANYKPIGLADAFMIAAQVLKEHEHDLFFFWLAANSPE